MIEWKCKNPGEWWSKNEEFLIIKHKNWVIYHQKNEILYYIDGMKTLKEAKNLVEQYVEEPSLFYTINYNY